MFHMRNPIKPLTVQDVADLLGKNKVVIHTTAHLQNWPGKPPKNGRWKIPAQFVIDTLGVPEDAIREYLVSGKAPAKKGEVQYV